MAFRWMFMKQIIWIQGSQCLWKFKKNIGLWSVILWLTVMLRKINPLLQVLTQSGLISTLEVKRSSKLEHWAIKNISCYRLCNTENKMDFFHHIYKFDTDSKMLRWKKPYHDVYPGFCFHDDWHYVISTWEAQRRTPA